MINRFLFQVELMCYVKELIQALAKALEYSLQNEINLFKRIEEENFQMIRLTKRERRTELLKNVRVSKLQANLKQNVL